ncbi:MAG: elongation factor G [Deltaproteobacteria bacterium]|jgi:elongation factor G|nr:elongation factor G [Deltaproteobacteria bacterium]
MSNGIDSQRTYALVGTGGCGKTSLAEMLLLQTGVINRLGKIEDGTTALDYEPEEIKRGGSIQPSFASYTWKDAHHYLMDIPGDGNFIGDLDILLAAADFAVFTLDAVDGVRPLTKKHWQAIRNADLPACCFINKLDRDRADFDMAYDGLATLGIRPVLLYAPIGQQADFKGVVDVLAGKALFFQPDGSVKEGPVPQDMLEIVTAIRDTTVENIAESDEVLMEKYLEEGSLSETEILQGLRAGVINGELVPVMAGSALENKGGAQLLEMIEKYLPSPLDRKFWLDAEGNELAVDPNGPAVGFVFKSIVDPFSGQLNMLRVISGSVNSESSLKNSRSGETERLGNPILLTGKAQIPTKETLGPGSLVALAKLKNTRTGDTLAQDKVGFVMPIPALPPQLISYAITPKEKGDEDKVFSAINKLTDEDVTLKLSRTEETGDMLLSGMGQLHIEMAVEKAKRRYKVDIALNTPKVPYRETFKGKAQVQGRHKKQTGGRGQFGDCWVEFEPRAKGEGYLFEDAIVGGVIPRQYIPAVDKGIQEASARGFLAGYPLVDFKAKLYDGSYHNVDSSEMAFKIAGSLAFKKAMESAKPILLEPIVTLTISIPDNHMGDVIGDLSSRRGKVLGSDSVSGITELKAHVPMSEILRYAPDLRSMTGGQGVFTAEFSHYEEAPAPVTEKVVAEYQQNRKADEE